MNKATILIFFLFILAAICFTILGYSSYFKTEADRLDTSRNAMEAAKAIKDFMQSKSVEDMKTLQ